MKIEDIVDKLGKKIDRRLILHKGLKIQSIKAIKTFKYEVFMLLDSSILILSQDYTAKVNAEDLDSAWEKYDLSFVDVLLDFIFSNKYPMVKIV